MSAAAFLWVLMWLDLGGHTHVWGYQTPEACEASRVAFMAGPDHPFNAAECVKTPLYDRAGTPLLIP